MQLIGKTTTQAHKDAARIERNRRHWANQKRRRSMGEVTEHIGPTIEPFDREAQVQGLRRLMEYYGVTGNGRYGFQRTPNAREKLAKYRDVYTGQAYTAMEWAERLKVTPDHIRIIAHRKRDAHGVRLERAA